MWVSRQPVCPLAGRDIEPPTLTTRSTSGELAGALLVAVRR
jgi:hypothetical protein